MAGDGMLEVVLTEDPEPSPAREDEPARSARPGPVHRRRRRVVLAALLAALAAVVVAQLVLDRERAARLAATPGLLPPLGAAPSVLWDVAGGSRHLLAADGDILLSGFLAESEQRLVAHDAASGERLWTTSLAQVPIGRSLACELLAPDDARAATHVVCRLSAPRPAGVDFPGYGPGSEQRLVVLDAGTGRVVDDRSLGLGFVATAVHDGDVLVAGVAQDGRVRLVRQDPVRAEVRWTFTSDDPLPGAGNGVGPLVPALSVQHGVVVLAGPVAWALSADGAVLGEWRVTGPRRPGIGDALEVTVLADGRFAVGEPGSAGRDGAGYGDVATPDGSERFRITGSVLPLAADDGTAAGALFTVPPGEGRIVAVDSATGERLWEAEQFFGGAAMVLDRRLVTSSLHRLVAVDTRTGRVLWTALRGRVVSDQPLLSDGHVVAVLTRVGATASITAVDVADGRVVWTTPAPPEVHALLGVEGRLFALGEERTVRMGGRAAPSARGRHTAVPGRSG